MKSPAASRLQVCVRFYSFIKYSFATDDSGPLDLTDVETIRNLAADQLHRVVSAKLRDWSHADLSKLEHCVNLKKLDISGSHSTSDFVCLPQTCVLFIPGTFLPDRSIVRHLVALEELVAYGLLSAQVFGYAAACSVDL